MMKLFSVLCFAIVLVCARTGLGENTGFQLPALPGLQLPGFSLPALNPVNGVGTPNAGGFLLQAPNGIFNGLLLAIQSIFLQAFEPIQSVLNQLLTGIRQITSTLSQTATGAASSAAGIANGLPSSVGANLPNIGLGTSTNVAGAAAAANGLGAVSGSIPV